MSRLGEKLTTHRVGLAVTCICLLVYLPSLRCGFINLDDQAYIINNPGIRHWGTSLFAQVLPGSWTPLTLISFAIDYRLWGLQPHGYHLTNILLHATNAGLVVLIAGKLIKADERGVGENSSTLIGSARRSLVQPVYLYPAILLLAGLLWGLHPLRVESVAWVSARKDVLNGALTLGAVLFYLRSVQAADNGAQRLARRDYWLSLVLFLLSLLAKQMSVTLPVILLLLDWYPLRRLQPGKFKAVLLEKIPYLAISLAITIVTVLLARQAQQFTAAGMLSFPLRCLVSGNAVFEYCRLWLYPVDIIPYYVLAREIPAVFVEKSVVVVIATLCSFAVVRRQPAITLVWFLFVIPLTPVLGFLHSGDDLALAARYTYLSAVAPALALAWLTGRLGESLVARRQRFLLVIAAGILAGLLLCYAVTTQRLVRVWENSGTFWSRVIAVKPVGRAYGERGLYYLISGKQAAAIDDLTIAIAIAEQGKVALRFNQYAFRGVAFSDLGRHEEAVADFTAAIALLPHPTYYQYRGNALKALGRIKEAEEDLSIAGLNPPPIDRFWPKQ